MPSAPYETRLYRDVTGTFLGAVVPGTSYLATQPTIAGSRLRYQVQTSVPSTLRVRVSTASGSASLLLLDGAATVSGGVYTVEVDSPVKVGGNAATYALRFGATCTAGFVSIRESAR